MNPLSLLGIQNDFKTQLEKFRPRLYRIAFSWSHNPELADDLVQDTMLKALRKSHQVKNRDAIDGWLFGILTNCWRDHFRRQREQEDIDNLVLVDETTPVEHIQTQNIVEKVRHAVSTLPAGQCQVMTLVDLEGMTYNEVAEILEIPIGTVMSRLCRARDSLTNKLLELRSETSEDVSYIRRVK